MIARTGPDDIWRIAYGESPDLPDDQESMIERSKKRIPVFLPGSKDYELVRLRPYWAQQRCAPSFRKESVLLAGDAAHVRTQYLPLRLNFEFADPACSQTTRSEA